MEGREEPPLRNDINAHTGPRPESFQLTSWSLPAGGGLRLPPRSMYVEMCWLPVLGPTTTWLYRRLGSWADANSESITIDTIDLSQSLGLGESLGRSGRLHRAVDRLVHFQAARWQGGELLVRPTMPLVPHHYLRQLGKTSLRYHEAIERQPKGDLRDRTGDRG